MDYYRKGSVGEKISGRESEGAWRQDELTGGKPPVVNWHWLTDWLSSLVGVVEYVQDSKEVSGQC
jgi:hypothetical protein